MGKRREGNPATPRRRWVIVATVLLVGAGGAAAWWSTLPAAPPALDVAAPGPGLAAVVADRAVARRETRPTLDPAGFTGQARLAYQVAREIPDVLDRMKCYCACDSAYGHLSLLSCYTDGHGST